MYGGKREKEKTSKIISFCLQSTFYVKNPLSRCAIMILTSRIPHVLTFEIPMGFCAPGDLNPSPQIENPHTVYPQKKKPPVASGLPPLHIGVSPPPKMGRRAGKYSSHGSCGDGNCKKLRPGRHKIVIKCIFTSH